MLRLAVLCLSALATLHADMCFFGGNPCHYLNSSSLIFRGKALAINSAIPQTMFFGGSRVPIHEITFEITEPLFQAKRGDIVKVIAPFYASIGGYRFVNAYKQKDGSIRVDFCSQFDDGLEQYLLESIRSNRTKASLTLNTDKVDGLTWARLTLVGPETREVFTSADKRHKLENLLPGSYLLDGDADGFEMENRNRIIWVGPASCPSEYAAFRGASKIIGRVISPGDKPINGIRLHLSYANAPGLLTRNNLAQSNTNGEFEFSGLHPGDFILRALSVPSRFEGDFLREPAAMQIRLNPQLKQEAIRFEITAHQTVKQRFRILDSNGKPFANKLVSVYCDWPSAILRPPMQLTTDATGWVEVSWIKGSTLGMRWNFLGGLVRKVIQVVFDQDGKEHDITID